MCERIGTCVHLRRARNRKESIDPWSRRLIARVFLNNFARWITLRKWKKTPRKGTYWSFIGGIPKVLDEFLTDKGRRQDSDCPTVQNSENNVEIPTQSRQNFLLQSFVEKGKYLPSAKFAKIKLISWKELFNSPYQEHFDNIEQHVDGETVEKYTRTVGSVLLYVAINLFICLK